MNNMRKVLCFLVALMLAAFALPALAAPLKIYSINVSPLGTTPVAVTIKNEAPNGNSTINSFVIQPPSGVTLTVASPASSAAATVSKHLDGNIYVNNFEGLKSGSQTPKTITIYLNATYGSSGPTCGTGYTWTAVVYTGNSFSQETFDPVVGTTPPTNATQSAPCNYSLSIPGSVPAGATRPLTATFTNASTSAGSFNSVTLNAPAGFTIASATLSGKTGTVSALPAGSVTISSISSAVAPGGSLAISLQVNAACNASTGTWGSSVAGGFALTGLNPSTTVTGACALTFSPAPPSALVSGTAFSVGVGAIDGSGAAITSFTGPVTLALNTVSGGPGTLVAGSSSGSGVVTFSAVTITGTGTFTLTASSSLGAASASATTSMFTVYQGQIGCDVSNNALNTNNPSTGSGSVFGTPGYAEGKRLQNKDGTDCILVDYTYQNSVLANNTVQLTWDTGLQPNAVYKYTVFWRPEFVDPSTGLPKRRTQVAWESDKYGITGPVWVLANACLTQTAPTPYTTLAADMNNSGTTLTVTGGSPPAPPFPIVIGTERMNVTAVSGTQWTVMRGQGGTTATAHLAVPTAQVVSTPLPIDPNATRPGGGPNPYVGQQDHICIFDEMFTSVVSPALLPVGSHDCTATSSGYDPVNPPACVQRSTSAFDIGDGFMGLD